MDVDQLFAAPENPTIGGKQYTLSPLVGDDWAKIKKRIVSQREAPEDVVAKLAPFAPPEVAEKLFQKAYDDAMHLNRVTANEENEWLETLEGMQYQFYLSIAHAHPEIDEAKAAELLAQLAEEHLSRVVKHLGDRFPDATPQQITEVAINNEKQATAALLASVSGMPNENPTIPATTPEPTSQ
jgi:flagellar biosynthesis/type III secretory pathway protein FliH